MKWHIFKQCLNHSPFFSKHEKCSFQKFMLEENTTQYTIIHKTGSISISVEITNYYICRNYTKMNKIIHLRTKNAWLPLQRILHKYVFYEHLYCGCVKRKCLFMQRYSTKSIVLFASSSLFAVLQQWYKFGRYKNDILRNS